MPAVFLHGGPGSGCRPSLCRLFDLDRFRVIAPDQHAAGAGHSRSEAGVEQVLVDAIETIAGML